MLRKSKFDLIIRLKIIFIFIIDYVSKKSKWPRNWFLS